MTEFDKGWNEAIDAAAKLVENYGPYNKDKAAKIRDLKRGVNQQDGNR